MEEKILVAKIYFDGSSPLCIPAKELKEWLDAEFAHPDSHEEAERWRSGRGF